MQTQRRGLKFQLRCSSSSYFRAKGLKVQANCYWYPQLSNLAALRPHLAVFGVLLRTQALFLQLLPQFWTDSFGTSCAGFLHQVRAARS